MYLGLKRLDNIPLTIVEFIIMEIEVVIMEDVEIGLKRPATLTLSIVE